MDPSIIIAIISSTINAWLPILVASVKNPASKAKLKKSVPALRAMADGIYALIATIESSTAKKAARKS